MDTKKTLRYNWEFGRETVAIRAEFDPEGVAEHCRFAGIEVPKEKPQKTKKQNRGEER